MTFKQNFLRDDLSNRLIHFTRDNSKTAIENFSNILQEKKIRGGNGYIKGDYKCVCFTETPISKIAYIMAKENQEHIRYKPFGFMYDKSILFKKGARPVIYQPDDEYNLLSEEQRFRHVKFELRGDIKTDLTWEREWRIKTNELIIKPDEVTLIVPNRECVEILKQKNFDANQMAAIFQIPEYTEKFEWHFVVLEDLGFEMQDSDCDGILE